MLTKNFKWVKWVSSILIIAIIAYFYSVNLKKTVFLPPEFKSYPKKMYMYFYENHGALDILDYSIYGDENFNGKQFCNINKINHYETSRYQVFNYDYKEKENFENSIKKIGGKINNDQYSNVICSYSIDMKDSNIFYTIEIFNKGFLISRK